jgi:hypothetical protein
MLCLIPIAGGLLIISYFDTLLFNDLRGMAVSRTAVPLPVRRFSHSPYRTLSLASTGRQRRRIRHLLG